MFYYAAKSVVRKFLNGLAELLSSKKVILARRTEDLKKFY
jgi:short-subunit dehydrogenase